MIAEATKGHERIAVNDITPLLTSSEEGSIAHANAPLSSVHAIPHSDNDKALPKTQIFFLCYARLFESIAFYLIFPFINQMILEVGDVEEANVGFYSGLVESLFSLTQMVLMIPWGRAADRFGRKPVLVFSLVGSAIATALFGISKSVWQMVLFRSLAGVFSGSIITIRTMIFENSTPKTQAQAFSFFVFAGSLGGFLGPLIGGTLANPADQYPKVLGGLQVFKSYPYGLATFVCGMIAASAALMSALSIKETLVRHKDTESSAPHAPVSVVKLIKYPGVLNVLIIYGLVVLLALAYTAITPVFWFTRPELGGYGFSPLWISIFLGATGFLQAIWVLFIFPPLQYRIGTGGVMRLCSYGFPLLYAFSPVTNLLLRMDLRLAFWLSTPLLQLLSSAVGMSFIVIQLALNDIAPSSIALGTLNAIALTITSGIRTVAPAIFTSIFAVGVQNQILWGYLVWVVMVLLALITAAAVRWLPKEAEGNLKESG